MKINIFAHLNVTSALAFIAMFALASTPALAQRGNNGNNGRGGSSSTANSTFNSRNNNSSATSRSSINSSRSSNSSVNRSSNSSFNSGRSSNSSANRSSNSSFNSGRSSRPAKGNSSHSSSFSRGNNSSTPIDSYRGSSNGRGSHSTLRRDGNLSNTERGRGEAPVVKGGNDRNGGNSGVRPSNERGNKGNNMGRTVTSGSVNSYNNGHRYATPYRPNAPLPATESHVHIHPAPYFYHPYHHVHIHMRPVYWNPYPIVPVYWPGFWGYCNNYWYDYHVTNTVVVREYVRNNYNVNLVSYVVSGNLMYAIIDDIDGKTYLKVFDDRDNLLAEQRINHRYNKCELDRENGGCWIFKNRNKSPMLFLYVDGQLLIYEED